MAHGAPMTPQDLAAAFQEMRQRTLDLIDPITDEDLTRQHTPLQSPITWDLGHIANFEELWLLQTLDGAPPLHEGYQEIYNAIEQPRPTRSQLPLLDKEPVLDYMAEVRDRMLKALRTLDTASEGPLARDGLVHQMILAHEAQHQETILTTLSLAEPGTYAPTLVRDRPTHPTGAPSEGPVEVPGGTFPLGVPPHTAGTYDNEWPRHEVTLDPFHLDRYPVTNGRYLAFIADGGYERPELWDEDGWAIRTAFDWQAPLHWRPQEADGHGTSPADPAAWTVRRFGRDVPLDPHEPVQHVSWYEADAFARWAGGRLPTEVEWEFAATWDPDTGEKALVPWTGAWDPTAANLDHTAWGPVPLGTCPRGETPQGLHQMIGDVWEWTASELTGYPGFEAFPYDEYSGVFHDNQWYVLRGGSWATRPVNARGTFRNWFTQDMRHPFTGFRVAYDDPPTRDPMGSTQA